MVRRRDVVLAGMVSWLSAGIATAVPPVVVKPGRDYDLLDPPQPTFGATGKIEVVEFFGYWCPHCRDLQPHLEDWLTRIPKHVAFAYVPVVWTTLNTRKYASMYYTLLELGRTDLHRPLYDAIDEGKKARTGRLATFEEQQEFAVGHGIRAEIFARTYEGDRVRTAVEKAEARALGCKIDSTPVIVVQGRYRADPVKLENRFPRMFSIVDYLIEKARSA
jgi:protein dithiol oxidoreductase (disulfide-forming)